MPNATVNTTVGIAGLSLNSAVTKTNDGVIGQEVTLTAGDAGTLTTRTDDNTGQITLSSGHGITTANTVDIYWTGGVRYGLTVTADAATTIDVDLGAGDALPVQDTAVVVGVRQEVDCDFDGDNVSLIAAVSNKRANMDFQDSGDATLAAVELTANTIWMWDSAAGFTNPLTGNPVDAIQVSCGEAATGTLKLGVLYDSV